MPFKTGNWGIQAKLRNCRRKEYFNLYNAKRLPNPEKTSARHKAYVSIKMPKDQLCEECRVVPAIDRHHPDYSKPLEVVFLCRSCHIKQRE
jgi:hypothetical protein